MNTPAAFPVALRRLARIPGLAAGVVLTIATGVAALAVAFTLADAAIFRLPPFPDAARLSMVYSTRTSASNGTVRSRWSWPRIQALRQRLTSYESLASHSPSSGLSLTGTDDTEPVAGEFVSPSYFTVLGTRPAAGRTFLESENLIAGAHPVVLLGFELWQRRYGSDPSIIGRTIGVNGQMLTVVGVLPRGFRGLSNAAQLWLPSTMAPVLTYPGYLTTNQNFISVVGKRRAGVSSAEATRELQRLGEQIAAVQPDEDDETEVVRSAVEVPLNAARVDATTRRSLLLLFGAVALLHILACINTTSLLLGRAVSQRHEAAVRAALGSGRGRLFRVAFAESMWLVIAGGLVGGVVAAWVSRWIDSPAALWGPRNFYGTLAPFADPAFGLRSLGFVLILSLVSAAGIALAPAIAASRVSVADGLRQGARAGIEGIGSMRLFTVRGAIVAAETGLAIVLLVAGGLAIDSFRRLRGADLGVDTRQILTFTVQPPEARVPPELAPAFIDQLLEVIRAVPGVDVVTVDGGAPVTGSARSTLYIQGRPAPAPGEAPPVHRHYVAPDHFTALGIPLLRGRAFTAADRAGTPRVAIISASAARTFWPDESPLGKRVWFGGGSSFSSPDSSAEIVGVVGDVVYEPLMQQRNPHSFYTPYAQFTYAWRMVMVRTSADPRALIPALRAAVRRVDPDLPLNEVMTLDARVGGTLDRNRFDALLFGTFSLLALLLSSTGIYAVVSRAVKQRTREMGIRLALGSSPAGLLRLVVTEGMIHPIVGLLLGSVAALAAAGTMRASLYGVAPTDLRVFVMAAGVLLAVAAVACAVPGRRAARVDPMESLRAE
jgi:predicted permease